MEKLEIKVSDEIKVADSLKKAIMIIVEEFKKWLSTDRKEPFNLTVKRLENKSPPALEINVNEVLKVKPAFGK